MELGKLITYSFPHNVGPADRMFRIVSGLALAAGGGIFSAPLWATIALAVFGLAWAATGAAARCGVYYLLGFSSCPISGAPNPLRRPAA